MAQQTNITSLKFGPIQINPNYVFFNRGGVFAMVVHNPIAKGRKFKFFIFRCIIMPKISCF